MRNLLYQDYLFFISLTFVLSAVFKLLCFYYLKCIGVDLSENLVQDLFSFLNTIVCVLCKIWELSAVISLIIFSSIPCMI
jgi:hypothetical protein